MESKFYVVVSADGGSTFNDLADFAQVPGMGFGAESISVVHVRGATWLVLYGKASETYVVRSDDDGATWTDVASLSTLWIRNAVVMGGLLVGLGTKTAFTGPVYSTDDGATWKYGNHVVEAGADHGAIALGGGQVCLVANGGAAMSFRVGDTGEPVT